MTSKNWSTQLFKLVDNIFLYNLQLVIIRTAIRRPPFKSAVLYRCLAGVVLIVCCVLCIFQPIDPMLMVLDFDKAAFPCQYHIRVIGLQS